MSERRRELDSLNDILEALGNIKQYTKGLTLSRFMEDRKTQDAVVRNFEIIGEASKAISEAFRNKHSEVPWKRLAGFRDKLIHFYFGIDYKIVWNIVKKELPALGKQLQAIKREKGGI